MWVYPYPAPIYTRESFRPSAGFTKQFSDGRVTAYNMVNGLMGLMYLSGHIDCADEFNKKLIRDGVDLYKEYRKYMPSSVPVYPTGTFDMDDNGVNTLGLLDKARGVLSLAIWNNSENAQGISVDLSRYVGECASVRLADIYPALPAYSAEIRGNTLRAALPGGKTALFAAIRFKTAGTREAAPEDK